MNKKEIMTQLRAAKAAHIQWRSYAQALIAGLPIEQDHVPVIHTQCKFGRWYYGTGQQLASLSAYEAIETPHEMLHQIYMKIFKILFDEDDRSMLQKMFGSTAKMNKKKQEELESQLKHLLSISRTLLEAINVLEREVMDMPEEEIEALY